MSTIKVNKIENTSTTAGGVAIDTSGHVQIDGQQLPTAGPLSNRNLIINGAMRVSQRYTSNSGQTASAYRACDRFKVDIDNLGTWTISQSTNAPADFVNSLRIECTTADASPAANDYVAVLYHVEAQDVSWINYGTADAKPLMLSFYVRSNKTGSGSFSIRQRDNADKLYSKVYSFSGTADVWKKVEIPIPADTAGLINNDNGAGLTLMWWLNGGSTFTGGGPTNGWEAFDDTKRNPTNAGIGGALNDYFEITGVQLEVGSKATPFEHESYGQALAKCQRYFYKIDSMLGLVLNAQSTRRVLTDIWYPVTMRALPDINSPSTDRYSIPGESSISNTLVIDATYRFPDKATLRWDNGSASAIFTAGITYIGFPNSVDTPPEFDAEL